MISSGALVEGVADQSFMSSDYRGFAKVMVSLSQVFAISLMIIEAVADTVEISAVRQYGSKDE